MKAEFDFDFFWDNVTLVAIFIVFSHVSAQYVTYPIIAYMGGVFFFFRARKWLKALYYGDQL